MQERGLAFNFCSKERPRFYLFTDLRTNSAGRVSILRSRTEHNTLHCYYKSKWCAAQCIAQLQSQPLPLRVHSIVTKLRCFLDRGVLNEASEIPYLKSAGRLWTMSETNWPEITYSAACKLSWYSSPWSALKKSGIFISRMTCPNNAFMDVTLLLARAHASCNHHSWCTYTLKI